MHDHIVQSLLIVAVQVGELLVGHSDGGFAIVVFARSRWVPRRLHQRYHMHIWIYLKEYTSREKWYSKICYSPSLLLIFLDKSLRKFIYIRNILFLFIDKLVLCRCCEKKI